MWWLKQCRALFMLVVVHNLSLVPALAPGNAWPGYFRAKYWHAKPRPPPTTSLMAGPKNRIDRSTMTNRSERWLNEVDTMIVYESTPQYLAGLKERAERRQKYAIPVAAGFTMVVVAAVAFGST